jgi:hypothetical protein
MSLSENRLPRFWIVHFSGARSFRKTATTFPIRALDLWHRRHIVPPRAREKARGSTQAEAKLLDWHRDREDKNNKKIK